MNHPQRWALSAVLAGLALSVPLSARAQSVPVYQSGTMTPNHIAKFATNGLVQDGGGLLGDSLLGKGLAPFAITDGTDSGSTHTPGLGLCLNSDKTSAAYHSFCLGHDSSGNPVYALDGAIYNFAVGNGDILGPNASVADNLVSFNATSGKIVKDSGIGVASGQLRLGAANTAGNWLETYIPPSASLGQLASIAGAVTPGVGSIGVVGAARSSDFSTNGINAYGLAGFAINDHASNADIAWSELLIAVRKTTAVGATLGVEINATNAVNDIVDVAPFTMFPATGITAGVWIAPSPCSFPAATGICASPTFNDSTAIGILGNGAVLKTVTSHGDTTLDGIASTTAIVVNGPVNGECIPTGTTVIGKTGSSVTLSNAATCSTTETVNFSSVHRKGIVFDAWGLDPATGVTGTVGVAIEMGMKQSFRWVDGTNLPLMTVYTDASGVLQFVGSNMRMKNSADAAERFELDSGTGAGQLTYSRYSDRGLPWWDVGKNTGNQFEVKNVQTGNVDFRIDTLDKVTFPNLPAVGSGTSKHFLCIDTFTKIIYDGTGASCN